MTKKMNAGKHWLGHGKIVGHFSDGMAEGQGGRGQTAGDWARHRK